MFNTHVFSAIAAKLSIDERFQQSSVDEHSVHASTRPSNYKQHLGKLQGMKAVVGHEPY
jgi:hypothetical protein